MLRKTSFHISQTSFLILKHVTQEIFCFSLIKLFLNIFFFHVLFVAFYCIKNSIKYFFAFTFYLSHSIVLKIILNKNVLERNVPSSTPFQLLEYMAP